MSDEQDRPPAEQQSKSELSSEDTAFLRATLSLINEMRSAGQQEEADQFLKGVRVVGEGYYQQITAGESQLTLKQALLDYYRDQAPLILALVTAIEKVLATEEKLAEAERDPLTEALSRRRLAADIEMAIKKYLHEGQDFSVIFMDLNDLKPINDTYGHELGDAALKAVYRAVLDITRLKDKIYRLSGGADEFVLLVPVNSEIALEIVQRIITEMEELNNRKDTRELLFRLSISVGIASASQLPQEKLTPRDILGAADQAQYRAKSKKAGVGELARSTVEIFKQE